MVKLKSKAKRQTVVLGMRNILKRGIVFPAWLSKIETLKYFNLILQELLPNPNFQARVRVVNWNAGVLSIAAESAAWAQQVHYMREELLFQFRMNDTLQKMGRVENIRCIVLPSLFEGFPQKKYWSVLKLSEENASLLRAFSASIENKELKQAILALARHQR